MEHKKTDVASLFADVFGCVVLVTTCVTFGTVVRVRRVCRECKERIDDDPLVAATFYKKMHGVDVPMLARIHRAASDRMCRECACPMRGVGGLCTVNGIAFLLCDECRLHGFRRMVNIVVVERVVRELKWRPRSTQEMLRGVRRVVRPHARTNSVVYYSYEVADALRKRVRRTPCEERRLASFATHR